MTDFVQVEPQVEQVAEATKEKWKPPAPPWDPSPDQLEAFNTVMDWAANPSDLLTLGGVAGSGKSYLMGKVAYSLIYDRELRVAFCAPTGRASLVLGRSLRDSGVLSAGASTIHSLIYTPQINRETGRIEGWTLSKEINADIIVVDEASMVNRETFGHLKSFGVPILAVGDHKQLPPVGEAPFLMADPDVQLNTIHRQAKDNPIIKLAGRARNGAPVEALLRSARRFGGDKIFVAKKSFEAREFGNPDNDGVVICHTNKLRNQINCEYREENLGFDSLDDPQPGEWVICLKNYRTETEELIPNGIRGKITACSLIEGAGKYQLSVDYGDQVMNDPETGTVRTTYANAHQFGAERTFRGWDEVPGEHRNWYTVGALYDFGVATSCHKFQGSSASNVAVFFEQWLLNNRLSEEESARWCYTAITRSSDRLMLIAY